MASISSGTIGSRAIRHWRSSSLSEDAVALLGWMWSVEEGIVFSWVLFKRPLVDQRNYLVATIGCPSCLSCSLLFAATAASKNEVEEAPVAFACLRELVLLPI